MKNIIITCRYRSRDQNGNFRKLKVADSRHLENNFLTILSLPRIVRFLIKFGMQMQIFIPTDGHLTKSKVFRFKMTDRRHIENRVLPISRRHIGRLMRKSDARWRITCRYRSGDQI